MHKLLGEPNISGFRMYKEVSSHPVIEMTMEGEPILKQELHLWPKSQSQLQK